MWIPEDSCYGAIMLKHRKLLEQLAIGVPVECANILIEPGELPQAQAFARIPVAAREGP